MSREPRIDVGHRPVGVRSSAFNEEVVLMDDMVFIFGKDT
jgi:hypothetical protein